MVVRMVYKSKVTSKFQITIPSELRKIYGIKTGSTVAFIPRKDGIEIKVPKKIDNIAEKLYGISKMKEDAVKATHEVRSHIV
ncbi:MAG TPA: AbrB/MazE/SpoVT family DNA-binding domain-containing protein [Euryarchaeota archaeon]|nr:AbrB/MazE/SpoVT family DNA-binding domain-containing protein [Euryarchaeota archaeon]